MSHVLEVNDNTCLRCHQLKLHHVKQRPGQNREVAKPIHHNSQLETLKWCHQDFTKEVPNKIHMVQEKLLK
eukprot:7388131-Prorocentrum_lima.AAC.1